MFIRKILAVDPGYGHVQACKCGHLRFPARFRNEVATAGVDLIESIIPIIKPVPENDTAEAVATAATKYERTAFAFEMSGWRTVPAPSKRTHDGGIKRSDDQVLMITVLITALKLRPDVVSLLAADGDFAPLVQALRLEGIRTEVIANHSDLASDLKRVAHNVVELEPLLRRIA